MNGKETEPKNGKIIKFRKDPAEPQVLDRSHIHINQEVAEQIVSALFGIKDTQMISKQKIMPAARRLCSGAPRSC